VLKYSKNLATNISVIYVPPKIGASNSTYTNRTKKIKSGCE
jgi:hypothetical protein